MTTAPPPTAWLRRGMRLPPTGWALAAMLALYVLAGLFGRDPWKGEDALHLGAAWQMLSHGHWLTPEIAGRAFDEPPLYYWSAALTGKAFGWLLPAHEAMRLASGLWIALTLSALYYAGRELYGQQSAAASPLLLAGCAGLLVHAHDAQPMLIALAAYGAAIGCLAALGRRPRLSGSIYGGALAACVLGAGIAPALPLLLLAPLAWWLSPDRPKAAHTLLLGLGLALLLLAPWPLALHWLAPERLTGWLAAELNPLLTPFSAGGLGRFAALLPWFAFPALPLAGWTLWTRRQQWLQPAQILPLTLFVATLLLLALAYRPREIPALLLLPPLALLATPGALSLRRGAANAFDWFAMLSFTLFVSLLWLAWSAMALGLPERLAQRVTALRPGFVGQFDLSDFCIGIAASLWWLWLIATAPRSPYRSLTHWTLGCTISWLLATSLILPWFDYGKSYRPVAEAVARALPDRSTCLAERGLTDTQRASLAYFVGLEAVEEKSRAGRQCNWLLVTGRSPREIAAPGSDWKLAWEGSRPGDRKEKFRLFRR